jgi:hypothetical protein
MKFFYEFINGIINNIFTFIYEYFTRLNHIQLK